jgi:hypothetical protein
LACQEVKKNFSNTLDIPAPVCNYAINDAAHGSRPRPGPHPLGNGHQPSTAASTITSTGNDREDDMTFTDIDDNGFEMDFADFAEWLEQVMEQERGKGEQEPWWFAPVDMEAARMNDIARRG